MAKEFKTVAGCSSSILAELMCDKSQTDAVINSGSVTVAVHSAIISNCSELLRNLLVSTQSERIILPGVSSVLYDFVTLVYIGTTIVQSEEDSHQLVFSLRMPESRMDRRTLHSRKITDTFQKFMGRIQSE